MSAENICLSVGLVNASIDRGIDEYKGQNILCAKCHGAWGDGTCLLCGWHFYIHSTWAKFFDSGKSFWEYYEDKFIR